MVKTLDEALAIGKAACDAANSVILQGSTQLENNHLVDHFKSDENDLAWAEGLANLFFTAHLLAIGGDEHKNLKVAKEFASIREMICQRAQEYLKADPTMGIRLAYYLSVIAICSKYSIGNCEEMAIYALKYIVENERGIRAELYKIQYGDHVVLVLNKSKYRFQDRCSPEKWGPQAVICDPWSKLVYPASEYRSYLKAYYRINGKNEAIKLIEGLHYLTPHESGLTSNYIHRQQAELLNNKLLELRSALAYFKYRLIKENERLKSKKEQKKATILWRKIMDSEDSIYQIDEVLKNAEANTKLDLTDPNIEQTLKDAFQIAVKKMQFSAEEQKKLFEAPTIAKVFRFFAGKDKKAKEHRTKTETCVREIAEEIKHRQIRCVR